jgi:nucleotide-binding universal stress UspA family protein
MARKVRAERCGRRWSRPRPGEVLVEHSADVAMLVVGSRGHGAFRGLLLGSVALHCVTHAHCPVTVVHPEDRLAPLSPVAQPASARG